MSRTCWGRKAGIYFGRVCLRPRRVFPAEKACAKVWQMEVQDALGKWGRKLSEKARKGPDGLSQCAGVPEGS